MSQEIARKKTRKHMVGNNIIGLRQVIVLVPQDEGLIEAKRCIGGLETFRRRNDTTAKEMRETAAANLLRIEHGYIKAPGLFDGLIEEGLR